MSTKTVRNRKKNGKTSRTRTRKTNRRQRPPDLVIRLGKRRIRVSQEDLTDGAFVDRLRNRCESSTATPTFIIRDLIVWVDGPRWSLFTLIAGLNGQVVIRFRNDDDEFRCLFDAVLHVVEDDSDLHRFEQSKRAVFEAATLIHSDRLDSACRQIQRRFRENGVRGLQLQSLIKQARTVAGQANDRTPADPKAAAEEFLRHLARHAKAKEGQRALRYYQDEFFQWTGKVWKRIDGKQLKAQVTRFLQQNGLAQKLTERFVRDVIGNLEGLTVLSCWDQPPPLWIESDEPLKAVCSPYVNFQNGMLNVQKVLEGRRMKLRRFNPSNFSQVVLPYDYDRKANCPLWEETLAEIFPVRRNGDRRIDVLQEFMGWTLVSGDARFEKYLILVGKGGNGKSTILNVWEQMLGVENVSHVPLERFNAEFRLHEMTGKLANISGDMNRVEKVEEGLLKELTSGDAIQVNRKFKSPLTMRPTARLIFATNALPPINDKSDGMWRRIIAMPFFVSFEGSKNKDRRRSQRLLDELPGIFNWAVEGAKRLCNRDRFSCCSVCKKCADDHRFHSDPFRQFIEDECILDSGQTVTPQAIYSAFRAWCERNGRKAFAASEFHNRVADLNGVAHRRSGSGHSRPRLWNGIGLQERLRRPD